MSELSVTVIPQNSYLFLRAWREWRTEQRLQSRQRRHRNRQAIRLRAEKSTRPLALSGGGEEVREEYARSAEIVREQTAAKFLSMLAAVVEE